MKSKKLTIFILFSATLLLIGITVAFLHQKNTVDFRGYVKAVVPDDTNAGNTPIATIIACDVFDSNSHYLIYAEYDTRITDQQGNRMDLFSLQTGDMIDLDYKQRHAHDGIRYAKRISVYRDTTS